MEDDVRVRRLPLHLTMHWMSPRRWLAKMSFLRAAASIVRREHFDIGHVYCTIGASLVPLRGPSRTRWVLEHQTGAVSSKSRSARWLEDRLRAAQGATFDVNLAVTDVLGRRLFGRKVFEAVPAGVNPALFRPGLPTGLRAELGIPADAIVFVHAGVLEAARGTDVPVRALAIAARRDPRIWLLMPGKGAQHGALRELAAGLGVSDRVWLPGYVPYTSIPRVFGAADAGLSYLPDVRYYEGQPPMKVIEYLGSGLPVLASDVSSHRLLVRHGWNGLLSSPDPGSYARLLIEFAGDPELRRRLAAAARQSVEHLTYDRIAAERLVPIYRRLMSRGGLP
jgi:glycosyltransferase involved in cell wall biosynthesis